VHGPNGAEVGAILDQAGQLTQVQVDRIAAMDGTAEKELHKAHLPDLGSALLRVSGQVDEAAHRVEYLADPAWTQASHAAMAAARAVGELGTYAEAERETLARRWRARGPAHT
jgi:hypothetical protein